MHPLKGSFKPIGLLFVVAKVTASRSFRSSAAREEVCTVAGGQVFFSCLCALLSQAACPVQRRFGLEARLTQVRSLQKST